ncbi:MAG: PIN domain-containing protein [Prevotella sp.]|nr:PIN domain-containing protein [Prevotella sp.]MBR6194855.1 PIN domain-containing protein [Prevotella sp.]
MEKYILDTCTWIEFFHERNGVKEHVDGIDPDQIFASEITLAELTYGAINSSDYERHIKEPQWLRQYITVFPISDVFEEYGQIRCALKKIKKDIVQKIGQFDILIGATALHYGLTVVTDNVKDFSLMPGVKCVNWVERT